MSLATLRDIRLIRKRPAAVLLVTLDCPRKWSWLRDDPAIIWLPKQSDVRSHDLRPLTGLPVTALVDSVDKRDAEVREALGSVGAVLRGIADGQRAVVTDEHPWSKHASAHWRDAAAAFMLSERNQFWSM